MSNALHRRLLLLSNSSLTGCEYMGWVKEPITTFLSNSNVTEVLFIPFAGVNITWDSYAAKVQEALPNLKIQPIHKTKNFIEAVNHASAIMIGGGNTFHLLYKLYEHKLLDVIRERVLGPNKIPYIGWSAGSNVAGPDIGTTNDMPIIWPPSDRALNLVPYNLNPHYNEWTPPNLKAETRIDRLNECILIKKRTLVAISEGVGIKVENGRHQILAPKLPDEFLKLKPEERVVKLWTYQDGKPEIVNVDLNGELNSKLNISSISLQ